VLISVFAGKDEGTEDGTKDGTAEQMDILD
jgi:hypothetical protein